MPVLLMVITLSDYVTKFGGQKNLCLSIVWHTDVQPDHLNGPARAS